MTTPVRTDRCHARRGQRPSLRSFAGLAAGVFCLLALSGPAAAAGRPVELNYATFFPVTHAHTALSQEWAREVEKRTDGAVKITVMAGGTLTPADQTFDSVTKGIADIGMSVASYTKGRFPLSEVIDLPLGQKNGTQATRLANAFYQKFQPKEMSDAKVMYVMSHGPAFVHTKKPIEKLEDLKGMKIRGTGTSAKVISSLGAAPVAMPMPETYDAVQKGVVDGWVSPIEALKGFRLAEVAKNTTQDYGASTALYFFVVMNKQKWEALPKNVQTTIEKINEEWIDKSGKVWEDIEKQGVDFVLSKGGKITALSPAENKRWADAVKPVLNDYLAMTKAKGLPGEEALKFCQEWLKKNP